MCIWPQSLPSGFKPPSTYYNTYWDACNFVFCYQASHFILLIHVIDVKLEMALLISVFIRFFVRMFFFTCPFVAYSNKGLIDTIKMLNTNV